MSRHTGSVLPPRAPSRRLRHGVLMRACLQSDQFQFAMRGQQHIGAGARRRPDPWCRSRCRPSECRGVPRPPIELSMIATAGRARHRADRNSRLNRSARAPAILRQHPRRIGNAALRGQGLLAADGDAPESAVHRVGRAEGRDRQRMILEVLELLRPFEGAVAHRRNDLEVGREGAQSHLEAHLVIARGGAAVRDPLGFQRQGHLRDGLCLQHAFRADAQRINAAPPHITHDQELEHLVEIGGARIDQVVFDGAQLARPLGQGLRRRRVDAAGVDGRSPAAGSVLEPGTQNECRGRRKKQDGLSPVLKSMSWDSASEQGEKALSQLERRAPRPWR